MGCQGRGWHYWQWMALLSVPLDKHQLVLPNSQVTLYVWLPHGAWSVPLLHA